MPKYHFEVRTPTQTLVTEGADLPDSTAARVEATKRIGDLLRIHAGEIWADQDWQMDVTDERGLILYAVVVSALMAPATVGTRRTGATSGEAS